MKAKITRLKVNIVGESIASTFGGASGRDGEKKLIKRGIPLSNGPGADIPECDFEVKTRDLDATSAHTVGTMLPEDIITTPYKESTIYHKLQQQYRIKSKDRIIVSAEVYDFSAPHIQEKIEKCYEEARQKIIQGDESNYISGGSYGFFERQTDGPRSYQFRFTDGAMKKLEAMSRSTFHKLFTWE
jgi:hypothetical protein